MVPGFRAAAFAAFVSLLGESSAIITRSGSPQSRPLSPGLACTSASNDHTPAINFSPLAFVGGLRFSPNQAQQVQAAAVEGESRPTSPSSPSRRLRVASSGAQQPKWGEPTTAGGASDRIGRALASMKKAFNEGAAGAGNRGGVRGGAAGGDVRGKRLAEPKQRPLRVGGNMLEGLDEEDEDEEDGDDEGDEELEELGEGLEDDDDDSDDEAEYADEDYDPIAPRGPLENNNYGEVWLPIQARPRRNRKDHATRRLVQESLVKPSSLIYPLFVHDEERSEPIPSLPGHRRLSPADVLKEVEEARRYGVNAFMLFPKVDDDLKSPLGEESSNPDGLMPRIIMAIKDAFPDALVLADVALDPYSTSGHDGVVDEETGVVLNDMTVYQICKQSVNLARAGADMVCPSEMMDGRVTAIREALDMEGCVDTSILSYACKYASSLYGPFREAVGSNIKGTGDKKTYQMDISNALEAEREAELDVLEGADMLMIKPGTPYLDVLRRVRQKTNVPLAAYQVSGEYAMIKAAAEKGWIDEKAIVLETLKGFRRAGADAIATYYAKDAAKWMAEDCKGSRRFTEPCF
ncbi:M16 family peptidase, putative [Eimeria praecox]|uniref:Delta-aminolevulinic acid dehydratase n=1 Tax=Eimeria praecox TaxID=51316 RepID=U6H0A2_9EIME|nr:M16 family peptidase, putative [Eimeria praecox]